MKRIILPSSSPRRIEMIKKNGYEPERIPANVDESIHIQMSCEAAVMYLAYKKASHVAEEIIAAAPVGDHVPQDDLIVIAADTIVVYGDEIMGKPMDQDDG